MANFYGSSIAQTIGGLTSARQMAQASGGTETSFTATAPSSGTSSYIELAPGAQVATASLPAPTGKGWAILLAGQNIASGSWSGSLQLSKSGSAISTGSIFMRWSRRALDGTFYTIAQQTLLTTLATAKTIYTLPAVTGQLAWFIANEVLYLDVFLGNGSTAWASDVFTVYVSNSASTGVTNDIMTTCPSLSSNASGPSFYAGGVLEPIANSTIDVTLAADARSQLRLTTYDAAAAYTHPRGTPCALYDSLYGLQYSGYTDLDKVTKTSPAVTQLEHAISSIDNRYPVDKRANQTNYINWLAGDIFADSIQRTLGAEGIIGDFALESDYTMSDFALGTLAGCVATSTYTPFSYAPNTSQPPATSNTGDLELTRAGTKFTLTESTTADFSGGTLVGMQAVNNTLIPTTQKALCFQASVPVFTDPTVTQIAAIQFWNGSLSIATNDTLQYDVWIASTSIHGMVTVDIQCSDGTTFLSANPAVCFDQNGYPAGCLQHEQDVFGYVNPPASGVDLFPQAKDIWYTRIISLAALSGKTITNASLTIASNVSNNGPIVAYLKNCFLGSHSSTPLFGVTQMTPTTNPPIVNSSVGIQGATNVVNAWNPASTYRVSPAHAIGTVGLVQNSTISWIASLPITDAIGTVQASLLPGQQAISTFPQAPQSIIEISYDNATWLLCTQQGFLPGLPAGANVTGISFYLRERFLSTPYPVTIPQLARVTIAINSAAAQTTTDITAAYATSSAWNSGTLTNVIANSAGHLTLSMNARNWADRLKRQQTPFLPPGVAEQVNSNDTLQLISGGCNAPYNASNFGFSRFDFLGSNITNFTLECDLTSSFYTDQVGIVYRTTSWPSSPVNNGFAYWMRLIPGGGTPTNGTWEFGMGTNSTVDNYTAITTVTSPTFLGPGTTHHIKIVVSGTNHQLYVDGGASPIINTNDSTYTGGGYIGMRGYTANGTCNGSTGYSISVSNLVFGATWGIWQSPSINISSLGTCGNTYIGWQQEVGFTTTSVIKPQSCIIQTSLDGGTTWNLVEVNGGAIPGLSPGTNVSGKSLLIQVQLYASAAESDPYIAPILDSLSLRVCGNYGTVTGTRISPVLSLTPVGFFGSSNAMYNANIPTGTSVSVATSIDNQATWQAVGNNGAGAPLSYWPSQPAATKDLYSSNTSANYTAAGGATWTYATQLSSILAASPGLVASGGTNATYLLNNPSSVGNMDTYVDMNQANNAGIIFGYQNSSNYYLLQIGDSASTAGIANLLRLYKQVGGGFTQLGSSVSVSFTHGTFHRIRIRQVGSLIAAYFDGICVLAATDTSFSSGKVGLYNSSGTANFFALYVQPLGTNVSGLTLYSKVTMTTSDPAMMPQLFVLVVSVRGASIADGALIAQMHPTSVPFAQYYAQEFDTLVSASGDYYWAVDKYKKLRFGPRAGTPAAFILQSQDDAAATNPANGGGVLKIGPTPVSVTSGNQLFRDREVVTDVNNLINPQPEIHVADGSTTSWTVGYPVFSAPTITVNGVGQTVGLQGIDSGYTFYWQPNSPAISYDSSLPKLPSGSIIVITYVGITTVNTPVQNNATITSVAAIEGNTGIVEDVISAQLTDTKGMTVAQATVFGNGLLSKFGNNNAQNLNGVTWKTGLLPGTVVSCFVPELGLWNTQLPINQVAIHGQIRGDGVTPATYENTVDASNGPNVSSWSKAWF